MGKFLDLQLCSVGGNFSWACTRNSMRVEEIISARNPKERMVKLIFE